MTAKTTNKLVSNSTYARTGSTSSTSECIAWFIVVIFGILAIVIFNLITIVVFVKQRQLQRRSKYLLIHLAIVDLLVGAVSGPSFIAEGFSFFCYQRDNTIVARFLWELFPVTSLVNIAAISLERLHATFFPFKHRFIKKWVYGVIVAVIWLMGCFSAMLNVRCSPSPQHHGAANTERKLTITLIWITFASLLSWLPHVVFSITTIFFEGISNVYFAAATLLLIGANSLINSIIYVIRIPEFRAGLAKIFCRNQNHIRR
ncbi:parapinopsin-like [Pocillopora verrucosa]|uniref:parapinopsin-like n=1 Tax=Pocillopora verrucosa TaxID=203993 RepID=UPI00334271E4